MLMLPASCDAKYVGPNAVGIQAHRQAMQDESEAAALAGARMFTNAQTGRTAESGDALKLRFSGETATLVSIAQSAAQGLERALKAAAFFVGVDPEQVSVTPNLDLVDATLPPADAVQLMQLWLQGAISKMTLYENLQKGEIASQERTLDEEQALIDEEVPPQQSTNSVPPQGSNSLTSAPTNAQIASWRADHANAQDIRTERESLAKAQASGGPNKGNPGAANSGSANKGSGNKGAV
jgi:hypothetical protein